MPHLPLRTADRFRGRSDAWLYGDVIRTLDWSVGRILAALKEAGVSKSPLVVFASDNGPWSNMPERMQQGGNRLWHGGSSGPLRGAKEDTYEGVPRLPAIPRWPGFGLRHLLGRLADPVRPSRVHLRYGLVVLL